MLTLGLAAQLHAAIVIDFNTTGDFSNNFNNNGPNLTAVSQVSSGGLNNSGALNATQGDGQKTTALYTGGVANGEELEVITQSLYFKYVTAGSASASFLFLGVSTSATGTFENSPSGYGWLAAGLSMKATPGSVQVYVSGLNSTGTGATYGASADLINGNWYYLAVVMTPSLTNWTVTSTLYNADGTGGIGSTLATVSAERAASVLNVDLYSGLKVVNGSAVGGYGVDLIDNYSTSVIPEPASLAMFLAGVSCILFFRRRAAREG